MDHARQTQLFQSLTRPWQDFDQLSVVRRSAPGCCAFPNPLVTGATGAMPQRRGFILQQAASDCDCDYNYNYNCEPASQFKRLTRTPVISVLTARPTTKE
jgi:hypothetical protein